MKEEYKKKKIGDELWMFTLFWVTNIVIICVV